MDPMSSFTAGPAEQTLLAGAGTTIAPSICYEIVYPELVRRGAAGAGLLLTVSNDTWFGASLGPLQHLEMARMRALENSRDLLRATNDDAGFVEVDGFCRTSVDGVWAVGDIINTPQLAHTAFAEGMVAITDILGEDAVPIDYDKVPWCIYCHPEVAFAGLTEARARELGYDVVVSKHRYAGNGRAMIVGETEGMVKIVAEKGPDGNGGRILGVHLVGPWVTEQLGQGYLAVNWEATVDEVAQFIQPHPTMSELFGESVLALTGRSLHG